MFDPAMFFGWIEG